MRTSLSPTVDPQSERRASQQSGFTLLEVLLAFAILAIITTLMTQIVSSNMEKAADAIDQRELREIADTLFGRILFEQTEHRDGDEGSIAVDYGQWAGLSQSRADRYSMYRWRLKKTEMVAAGASDESEDTESLTGDGSGSGSGSEESSSSTGATGEGEQNKVAVKLMRFTLTIFRQSDPDKPLATLTRFLPPPDFQGAPTK